MRKAGGIIAIIAGIFSILVAGYTFFAGQISEVLDLHQSREILRLGWVGILTSFAVLTIGTITVTSEIKRMGDLLVFTSFVGIGFGNVLNAIFMGLACVGGILIIIEAESQKKLQRQSETAESHSETQTPVVSTENRATAENKKSSGITPMKIVIGLTIVIPVGAILITILMGERSIPEHGLDLSTVEAKSPLTVESSAPTPIQPAGDLTEQKSNQVIPSSQEVSPIDQVDNRQPEQLEPTEKIDKSITTGQVAPDQSKAEGPPSFDCSKASSNVEKMICGDKELSRLDREMSHDYHDMERREDPTFLKNEQMTWLKERNACQTRECIKQAFVNRITQFAAESE